MKTILNLFFLLAPFSVFAQFSKSFTNVTEYRFSNELAEAVDSERFAYGMRLLDSVLLHTDTPDKSVVYDGVTCCVKTSTKDKLQQLVSLAKVNGLSLSGIRDVIEPVYPELVSSSSELFVFQPDAVKLFSTAALLAQIMVDDQVCRSVTWKPIVDYSEKLGYTVTVDHFKSEMEVDSVNQVLVDSILLANPTLSKSEVGRWGMVAVFSIIQHSHHLEKYQILMERWYENGDIPPSDFALYTDRLLVYQGKPQLYGTQLYSNGDEDVFDEFVFDEFEDIHSIERLRMKMGLGSIERYAKSNGVDWAEYLENHK